MDENKYLIALAKLITCFMMLSSFVGAYPKVLYNFLYNSNRMTLLYG